MKVRNILFAFWMMVVLTACDQTVSEPNGQDIFGYWRYLSGLTVEGSDISDGLNPVAHLELNEDGTMSGFTSRNLLGGTFTYDSLGGIEMKINLLTRVADTPWSGRFTQIVEEVDGYRREDDLLILMNSSAEEQYVFRKVSPETCLIALNDKEIFQNISSDPYDLLDARVAGPCLEILIGYGGGCEDDIGVTLVGSGLYAYSLPPQLDIKLVIGDDDPCEAYIRRTYYFDYTNLLPGSGGDLQLNLEGWDTPLLVTD